AVVGYFQNNKNTSRQNPALGYSTPVMKTISEIYSDLRNEFSAALADKRNCYDITPAELDHAGSQLADMVNEDGHASLKGYLNDGNAWSSTVAEQASILVDSLAMLRAEAAGIGQW